MSNIAESDYQSLCDYDELQFLKIIQSGIPASDVKSLADSMDIPIPTLCDWLGFSAPVIRKLLREEKTLPVSEGERYLGLARLVGMADKIVADSGNPEGFNAAKWTGRWLNSTVPALQTKPCAFLNSIRGQAILEKLLLSIQSGAYW